MAISHHTKAQHRSQPLAWAVGLACSMGAGIAMAAPAFEPPDESFKGRVAVVDTPLVVAGTEATLAGRDFKPGQEVRLSSGGVLLGGDAPLVVGADGRFRTTVKVPANTPAGQHPLVVTASKPAAALVVPLKVSSQLPLSGQARFNLASQKLVPGLYQAAYSARGDRLYVTSAVGRPPVTQSQLLRVHPRTLAVEAQVAPPAVPAPGTGVYAVYGVAVDDANGTVWVTNTRQNTVAVYRQSDLSLLKQFEPGLVDHARDVVVDEVQGKVYASANGKPELVVFDAKRLERTKTIPLATLERGGDKSFSPMSLELDRERHKLYTVSIGTNEAAVVDTRSDSVDKVFALDGAKTASGVAFDARTNRLLVASQGSDNLIIVDAATGKTLHDVKVGAGPLNVALDHTRGLAYVPNRASGTVAVVSLDGQLVANLPAGTYPNHVAEDGQGTVYAINKSRGDNDAEGDRITRITPVR